MNNKIINVKIGGENVGRLAMTKNYCCAFEYDSDWLANGFSISPFSLPLEKKVFVADR
jgi:serine/threonine-protein kinase HipA